MRHVLAEDLEDMGRLHVLFGQAVKRGLIEDSEDGLLRFVAAAEHCRRLRKQLERPEAAFAALVLRGRWLLITNVDEDRAHRRLKRWRGEA